MSGETAAPDTAPAGTEADGHVVAWIQEQVRVRPSAPSLLVRRGERWVPITWGQFGDALRRIAAFLLEEGCAVGDHVAIWAGNRPEWHTADAGILSIRCVPVPVYQTLSIEQGRYVLEHSQTVVAFAENEQVLAKVGAMRDRLPRLRRVVVMQGLQEPPSDGYAVSWEEALARGDAALPRQAEEIGRRTRAVEPDDIVTLIYTSGTTGPPKAVMLTHRNVAAANRAIAALVSVGPDDRVLSYLPLAHIAERMVSEFRSYRYGNPTYFLDSLPNLGRRLCEVRPTHFFGVPRVWEKMRTQIEAAIDQSGMVRRILARWAIRTGRQLSDLREEGRVVPPRLRRRHALAERLVLRRLRAAIGLDQATICASGAAPIDPEVLRFFGSVGIEVCEVYGQSEGTALTSMNIPGDVRIGTVGRPVLGNEVRIADDGEILVRGGVVFAGYLHDEEATREALQDGWLHTGDVGEFDADGRLRITDRKKDLIITAGGKNVAPGAIELALAAHPLVSHAVAIGDRRPYMTALLALDGEAGQRFAEERSLPADLEALASAPLLRAELQEHVDAVNARLNHVEQIKRFLVLGRDLEVGEELTPTLKVKRRVVAQKYATQIEELYADRSR